MIEFTKAYVANGKTYATLEEAQVAELTEIFKTDSTLAWTDRGIAERILACQEKIVDLLTTTPASKPRARAINGGRKPRKAKGQSTLPLIPEASDGKAA